MMNSSKRTAINSAYSLLNQIVTLGIALVLRKLTIVFVGVEVLGISSAIGSLLDALSLAEMGFSTAIIYFMYEPLHEKQYERISSLMTVFRFIYLGVATFVLIGALICIPFLGEILKGVEITSHVYVYYALLVGDSIVQYMLAYKRVLLYADQKEYFSQRIDVSFNVVFSLSRIIIITCTHRFDLFLLSKVVQTAVSNLYIHKKCSELYPDVKAVKLDLLLLKNVMRSVRHIFSSKLAYYINTSTDNIVISSIIGAVEVGLFTNYTTVTLGIKRLAVSIMKPVSPLIGDILADRKANFGKRVSILGLYTHITYMISLFTLIPTAVLLDMFICALYGEDFLLNGNVCKLLIIDLFITFMHRGCCDYINGLGLFKQDKYIEYIAAFINITASIVLAHCIGVVGVLLGTVVSGLFFWIGRSWVVFKNAMNNDWHSLRIYWMHNIKYFITFGITYYTCVFCVSMFDIRMPFVVRFLLSGCICEMVAVVLYFPIYFYTDDGREVFRILKKIISR